MLSHIRSPRATIKAAWQDVQQHLSPETHASHVVLQLQALASNLLGRAKDLASNEDLGCDVCFQLNLMLANVHATHAQHLLATPQADGTVNSGEAIGLLNAANEIIGNLSSDDDDPDTEDKITAARQLSAQVRHSPPMLQCQNLLHIVALLHLQTHLEISNTNVTCSSACNS